MRRIAPFHRAQVSLSRGFHDTEESTNVGISRLGQKWASGNACTRNLFNQDISILFARHKLHCSIYVRSRATLGHERHSNGFAGESAYHLKHTVACRYHGRLASYCQRDHAVVPSMRRGVGAVVAAPREVVRDGTSHRQCHGTTNDPWTGQSSTTRTVPRRQASHADPETALATELP